MQHCPPRPRDASSAREDRPTGQNRRDARNPSGLPPWERSTHDCSSEESSMTLLGYQIASDLIETHRSIRRACAARVMPKAHLDAEDDDYEFVEQSLERCADRGYRDGN
jgi:hypothetical protein